MRRRHGAAATSSRPSSPSRATGAARPRPEGRGPRALLLRLRASPVAIGATGQVESRSPVARIEPPAAAMMVTRRYADAARSPPTRKRLPPALGDEPSVDGGELQQGVGVDARPAKLRRPV